MASVNASARRQSSYVSKGPGNKKPAKAINKLRTVHSVVVSSKRPNIKLPNKGPEPL